MNTRVLPHSLEAERAVLGGLLLNNQAWDKVAVRLQSQDFYLSAHRLLFSAMESLFGQNRLVDVTTVHDWLRNQQQLETIGGQDFLLQLLTETVSAAHIESYADLVRERALLRALVEAATQIIEWATVPKDLSAKDILDRAQERIFGLSERLREGQSSGLTDVRKHLREVLKDIRNLQNNPKADGVTGLPTGFIEFDKQTSGLQKADFIVIAGRPSMGKSTFAFNIAEAVAITQGRPVAFFSLEMPGEQLAMRMLASLSRITLDKLRRGDLSDHEWTRIVSGISLMANTKLFIDDTPNVTVNDIRSRCRQFRREQNDLALVVIDYLQLMQSTAATHKENRTQQLSETSRALKLLARELQVPVIALSQLNRSLESRSDKRPMMSDLRESGAIEQDADLIVFIYRDEVYDKNSKDKNVAEIIIAKQRNGPIGTMRLSYAGHYTRFDNLSLDINDF
jgi:replicative DNA helicase